ncbi:MAG: PilN domain-containing protein [Patescibacteria group bacterium]|jgi:Tfp pilus assembly protein PilN|nr:PilN domain-containing protein [Patescibacteria group bacterium]
MFKINLIPEVKIEQQRLHKINTTVTTVATVVAIVLGVVIFGLLAYNVSRQVQISSLNSSINKTKEELVAYADLEKTVLSLEKGLAEIKQILAGGTKWSKFFAELEKATPADTQITSFDIKGDTITLTVTGKDVRSIDRFIKSFSNYKVDDKNLFKDVSVNGYTIKDNGNVSFQVTMTLESGVLWQ